MKNKFLLFSFSLVLSVPICLTVARTSYALSYSCNNHCYGENTWFPNYNYNFEGVGTNIGVRGIWGGNGVLTNEAWLGSYGTNKSLYWIEAGYLEAGGGPQEWFWADNRPGGGYHAWFSGPLNNDPGGNSDYGHGAWVSIYRTSTSTWHINVSGNRTGFSGNSASNTIYPDYINIGEELIGTSGANGPTAAYTYNEYQAPGSNYWYFFGRNHYDNGYITGKNPPWSTWLNGQNPDNSNTGGVLGACVLPSPTGHYPC